jgi:hypothetical protein
MSWDILKQDIYDKWKLYWFQLHPPDVAEYSWSYLFTGGKEIRAKLFCDMWHYLSPDLKVCGELAFAIECIHVTSIVLDDTPWMDNAAERRGRKTLHTVFTPKKALLISYGLMNMVRHIWTNNRPSSVSEEAWNQLLISKLKMLAVGQLYDIEKRGSLIELASLKTGTLFELVSETVACCVGLDPVFWRVWGNRLGILFQWMDDWLDRHEDVVQQNRNAFNEAYDATLNNYWVLWRKLERGISAQWFTRPFGIWMRGYFTERLPRVAVESEETLLLAIQSEMTYPLVVPEVSSYDFEERKIPAAFTGKDIVQRIYAHADEFFSIPSIQTNLWRLDEDQWEHVPEIRGLLERAKQAL